MLRISFAMLVALLLPSAASSSPGNGIDLQWNDCVGGPAALQNFSFNCTGTVDQTRSMIFNFKVNQDVPRFVAITSYLQLDNVTPGPLAPFWHYEVGGCQRMGGGDPDGVTLSSSMPVTTHCTENFTSPWEPSGGFGAIVNYTPDSPSPGHGVFVVVMAAAVEVAPLTAGTNYFAMALAFNNRNRASCTGCSQQAGLTWTQAMLESDDGSPAILISSADKGQRCASFNGGVIACQCACTPALNRTWGSLKAMYR